MQNNMTLDMAVTIDELVLDSRIRDLAVVVQTGHSHRVGALWRVMSRLPAGAYLIGCGPYCSGVMPLTVDEVVIGRPSSPFEAPPRAVADYTLNDAIWLVPREASRIHASIVRRPVAGQDVYWLRDLGSQAGTYLNGVEVVSDGQRAESTPGRRLSNRDVISLGPSGVNRYMFCHVTDSD